MIAHLVQHGEATVKEEDPRRPLTDRGRRDVDRVARTLASRGVELQAVWHSGKLRAEETAEIFQAHLRPAAGAESREGLAPLDDPREARAMLEEAGGDVMLVGHLPQLSRLASLLLTGDPERELVAFRNGGVVRLRTEDPAAEGSWRLDGYLTPEMAAG